MAGVNMVHVPYQGAKGITDLVAGEVQAMITSPTAVTALARAGKLRMLATSGSTRAASLPDVPTVAESGLPGYESSLWYAIVGPRGVPRDIVARLNSSIRGALAAPDLREKFEGNGVEAQATSPEELAAYINSEIAKWKSVIEKANIRM